MTRPRTERPAPVAGTDLNALQELLQHRFSDTGLLLRAVTHRSYAHEAVDEDCLDNESLEFLGDAVLAFIVAECLFRKFPGLDEGRLSKHKSLLEKAATLAEVARELGLGDHLRLGRGERLAGGARNDKILSNAYEALVAATFLDGGLDAARRFVAASLEPRLLRLDAQNPINDYKSALQERTQALSLGTPTYEVFREEGPDHDKRFHVRALLGGRPIAEGDGCTKRGAEQVAARRALARVEEEAAAGVQDGGAPSCEPASHGAADEAGEDGLSGPSSGAPSPG